MSRALNLKDELYDRLTRGAALRGLTVKKLLEHVADAIDSLGSNDDDRRRSRRIETLLANLRRGTLNEKDRQELDRLIDQDYRVAIERADQRIASKLRRSFSRQSRTPAHRTLGASHTPCSRK